MVNLDSLSQRNYFIPSYQRGYRWGKQQVKELLDDILDYANGKGHEVSIHGAQALKIYDSMTDDDIAALIADVERRVAEVQSAEDPFNMTGAEA